CLSAHGQSGELELVESWTGCQPSKARQPAPFHGVSVWRTRYGCRRGLARKVPGSPLRIVAQCAECAHPKFGLSEPFHRRDLPPAPECLPVPDSGLFLVLRRDNT